MTSFVSPHRSQSSSGDISGSGRTEMTSPVPWSRSAAFVLYPLPAVALVEEEQELVGGDDRRCARADTERRFGRRMIVCWSRSAMYPSQ
jgi:hypothetical protein